LKLDRVGATVSGDVYQFVRKIEFPIMIRAGLGHNV